MRSLALIVALPLLLLGCRDKAPARGAPVITIMVEYPGASAEVIEASIVLPIERAVNGITGLQAIESRMEADRATVMLELESIDQLDGRMHEVLHALSQVQTTLPRDVLPPTISRTRRDDQPIVWFEIGGSGALPITELSTYAREEIVRRLQRLPGVGEVEPHGLADLTVTVWPDLEKVTALGLVMFDVLAALQATEVSQIESLGEIIIKQVGDSTIRLRDVARIEAGFERAPGGGAPMIAVRAQATSEPATVLRAVREEISKLRPELPPGMTLTEAKPPSAPRPRAPLAVTVWGPSLEELDTIVAGYIAALKSRALEDVVRDPPAGEPEQTVAIDRDAAARLGVPLADVSATLRVVGSTRVGYISVDGMPRPIVTKLSPMPLPEALEKLSVKSLQGNVVPISQIVAVKTGIARQIVRRNQIRSITLSIYANGSQRDVAKKLIADRPVPKGYQMKILP